MLIVELETEDRFCEIYQDKWNGGWYAVRQSNPKFCVHAKSLQTLGLRLKELQDFYIKYKKKVENGEIILPDRKD